MGNTRIQTTLVSPGQASGVVNDVDVLTEAIMALVRKYIPGLPPVKNFRDLAVSDIDRAPIPCLMVHGKGLSPTMETSQRFQKWYEFYFVAVVGADTPEDCEVAGTDAGVLFVKLFSNNALNDIGTSGATNSFMVYPRYWLDSKMSAVAFNPPFVSGRTPGPKYVTYGEFTLRLQTVPAQM